MSTALKMFLLAVFAVILVMAAGCDVRNTNRVYYDVVCESPFYTGPAYDYYASRNGTWIRLPGPDPQTWGQVLDYGPAVKCEGRRR